jgi:hypothetical protein
VTSHHAPHTPDPTIRTGVFHKPRDAEGGTPEEKFREGVQKIRDTQCADDDSESKPTGGVRKSTDKWPLLDEETNLNDAGGLCGMPTQFLNTMRVGGLHRIPRFMSITEHQTATGERIGYSEHQTCDKTMQMYIPYEILYTLPDTPVPSSPGLDDFLAIAFDGVGTIDSAWDSCTFGCNIPLMDGRQCGGEGLDTWTFLKQGETHSPTPVPEGGEETDPEGTTASPTDSPTSFDRIVIVTVDDTGTKFLLDGKEGDFMVKKGEKILFDATDVSVRAGYHQFRVRQTGKYASPGGVVRTGDQTKGEKLEWVVGAGVESGSTGELS